PKLLLHNAQTMPNKDAVRENEYGVWQTFTWKSYANEVKRIALGMAAEGFKRGDKLAIIGNNRARLYFGALAAQALGGVSVGMYQDSIAKELAYVVEHAETRFVLAEDEEQVDKLFEIKEQIPHVEKVIYENPRGLESSKNPWLIALSKLEQLGDEFAQQHPNYFENEVAQGKADDVSCLSYTSGTTGLPKGAMLTHRNLMMPVLAYSKQEGWNKNDEFLAYLPMAWVGDLAYTVGATLVNGSCFNVIENPSTMRRDYRAIGPTFLVAPPAVLEQGLTRVQVLMEEADFIKRGLYNYFMGIAVKVEELKQARKQPGLGLRLLNLMGNVLVRAPLRDLLGSSRIRYAYTGGAPIGPDVFNFYRALGMNLKQFYGSTETSGGCVGQPNGHASADNVGFPLKGVEVKVAENGEILIRGEHIFKGYYKNDEATKGAIDAEGYFHTGDAGFFDPGGYLKVIDRAKDVSYLNDKTMFAPQYLENKLKFSPYIKEAVTYGASRNFVAAMINIDLEALESWAEHNSISYSGYQELSQKPEVYRLIDSEISRINQSLAADPHLAGAQIKRFLILNKELDADDGEITRTRKLRRNVIADRYKPLVDALYTGADKAETEIVVTYEDGREGKIKAAVKIQDTSSAMAAKVA
ncbi:MAG: AMP-binding protein, partial [Candidatus Lambdaproteobacteria bacterium]|nr:AMP-binding protein [Candidatus Lambdaproteobacteria bacterium]